MVMLTLQLHGLVLVLQLHFLFFGSPHLSSNGGYQIFVSGWFSEGWHPIGLRRFILLTDLSNRSIRKSFLDNVAMGTTVQDKTVWWLCDFSVSVADFNKSGFSEV